VNLREKVDHSRPDFPVGTPFWEDPSFRTLLERCPKLTALTVYLPSDLKTIVFDGQTDIQAVQSSYKDHGYGYLFYALTRVLKPIRCVEFGVLQGFSLLSVAAALRDNRGGNIQGFDLFDDYPYQHESEADVLDRIKACGLPNWAQAYRADAFQMHESFDNLDYLHVDISNNGDTYRRVFEHWASKVRQVIILEGGSDDRDQVEWMIKYEKRPIVPVIHDIRRTNPDWTIATLEPFPSLTVAMRSDALTG